MRTEGNLALHELIGLPVEVAQSTSQCFEGLRGKVVDETRNTFVLETRAGGEKRVPKKGCIFAFTLNRKKVRLEGNMLAFRPEDRPKKLMRLI